ncbi:17256_t:CDS:2, partial [Funneliformis caledonium]
MSSFFIFLTFHLLLKGNIISFSGIKSLTRFSLSLGRWLSKSGKVWLSSNLFNQLSIFTSLTIQLSKSSWVVELPNMLEVSVGSSKRISSDPEDIYQKFSSEEYAELMYLITQFHVQDPLVNAFIQFFNKYLKRDDYPLSSTSQVRRVFMEYLQFPNF